MANKLNLDFSKGMNSHTSPLVLKDNEAELILNYNLDKLGALTRRNGYELFASNQVQTGQTQCGLVGTFNPNNRSEQVWMSVNSGAADPNNKRVTYYHTGGAWVTTDDNAATPFLPAGTTDQQDMTEFFTILNYTFRLTGADAPVSFLVTAPDTKTTVNLKYEDNNAIAITPSLGVVFGDRAYINNSADGLRSRLYYSTPAVSGGTITWGVSAAGNTQWFDVSVDDGDFITALENNGNHLLIFKNNAIYRWVWGQVEADRVIGIGTPSQKSVKTNYDVGITFFANPKGIYTYQSGGVKLISSKIQEYVDAVTSWKYVAGGVDKDHYYLSVGDITVNGRTISNAVFCYHILLDAWTIYSFATKPTVFATVPSTYPSSLLIFGTSNGNTNVLNTATSDTYRDGGVTYTKAIDAEVITKEHLLTFPEKTKLENIDVIAIQGGDTKISYQVDRNLTGSEGDFISCKERPTKRITTCRVGKEMHTVRLRFADNSTRSSVIEGYNLEHTPTKSR